MSKPNRGKKTPGGRLVVKDNKLINARYNLGVAETRLFLTMITQIRQEDEAFKTYRIYISDFVDSLGTSSKNMYKQAEATSERLIEKVLKIEEEDGPLQVSFLSSAKYYRGEGYVDLSFDPKLMPYLLKLKEKFTAYDIRNILQLKSAHSIRIYELLKQYEKLGERRISVQYLKETLGVVDQYQRYNDFKRFVLLQAQKELKANCDIAFEFKEIKKGRRIEGIHFFIRRSSSPTLLPNTQTDTQLSELEQELLRMGLSKDQAHQLMAEKEEQRIREVLGYTKQRYEKTKGTENEIRNLPAYLLRVFESENSTPEFVAESTEKDEVAKARLKEVEKKEAETQRQVKLIKELEDKYRAYRRGLYEEKSHNASDADLLEFESHVKENPFLTKKFIKDGILEKDVAEMPFWLGSFLVGREWPDTPKNFMDWVYQEHGYQLQEVQANGETTYTVVGQQLFNAQFASVDHFQ